MHVNKWTQLLGRRQLSLPSWAI